MRGIERLQSIINHKQVHERQAKNPVQIQKEKDKVNHMPKYSICASGNIQKITVGTKVVKTAAFGVIGAIDDAGKTYKCENYGSKFKCLIWHILSCSIRIKPPNKYHLTVI